MYCAVRTIFMMVLLKPVACQLDLLGGLFGGTEMNFMGPFGGVGGRRDLGMRLRMGGGIAASAPVNPAIARQSRLTAAEENLAELLTESGANDPARQRVERMLQSSGGRLTGAAESLNYLVQEFYMTTPGPVPPPNTQPRQNAQMGPQVGAGAWAGQYPQAMPRGQRVNMGQRWQTGARNTGGRRQLRNRASVRGGARNQSPVPTTTAIPEWQQWLFGSQSQTHQANNALPKNNGGPNSRWSPQHNLAQSQQSQRRQARPPQRQLRPRTQKQTSRLQQQSPPPQRQASPPKNQSLPPPSPKKIAPVTQQSQNGASPVDSWPGPPASSNSQTSKAQTLSSQRTSIAVERLKKIQQRIDNLLKSQSGSMTSGANQQLTALQEIRDILSGKRIKKSVTDVTSGPSTSTRGGRPPANPAYETKFGPIPPQEQVYPLLAPQYDPAPNHQNNNLPGQSHTPSLSQTNGVGDPIAKAVSPARAKSGSRAAMNPIQAKVQGPKTPQTQQGGAPVGTTKPPNLGDVRYIGQDKYVYSDVDGFDTFQWRKATNGPPAEGPNHHQQQHAHPPAA